MKTKEILHPAMQKVALPAIAVSVGEKTPLSLGLLWSKSSPHLLLPQDKILPSTVWKSEWLNPA